MSIRKEDIYQLVDLVKEKDAKLVYDLIKVVVEKDNEKTIIVEADNSPLNAKEKRILKEVENGIDEDDLVDWDDING